MNTTTIYAKTGIGVKYRINDYCVDSSVERKSLLQKVPCSVCIIKLGSVTICAKIWRTTKETKIETKKI